MPKLLAEGRPMTTTADLIAEARKLDAEAMPRTGLSPNDTWECPNCGVPNPMLRRACSCGEGTRSVEQLFPPGKITDAAFFARARPLLPQLADALKETDALATQAGIDAETQYQRALRAEARLTEIRATPIEVYGAINDVPAAWRAKCPFCETITYQKPDDHRDAMRLSEMAHPDNCPARPMEPG